MDKTRSALAFISYRRQDTSPYARWVAETIETNFGPGSVFIDTDAVRMSEKWKNKIDIALREHTVFIAIIGPNWLKLTDEFGRRRLDLSDDWVASELAFAIKVGRPIIPLLVGGAQLPQPRALPSRIVKLVQSKAYELSDNDWKNDREKLISSLVDLGFKRISTEVRFPVPYVRPNALTRGQLTRSLTTLPHWTTVRSILPNHKVRDELMRQFDFDTFEEAMQFVQMIAEYATLKNHHPRWENVWVTLTIWLTTWDIGHKPSRLDIDMAKHIERMYIDFHFKKRQPNLKSVQGRTSEKKAVNAKSKS
jgi:pterin-4a-carbinolamine dehydratase